MLNIFSIVNNFVSVYDCQESISFLLCIIWALTPLDYRKEGNVLFNDALNTFYLQLYGVGHMVKDHSDSERGNPLPPYGLLFPINSKGSFICTTHRIAHTTAFVTPVVEHWLEWEIAQWVHPMKDRSDDLSHHERTLLPQSYISLPGLQRPLIGIKPLYSLAKHQVLDLILIEFC